MIGQNLCLTDWQPLECLRTGAIIFPKGYNLPRHFHVDVFQCSTCRTLFTPVTTSECRNSDCAKMLSTEYIFREGE